jgi:hypothetical protein
MPATAPRWSPAHPTSSNQPSALRRQVRGRAGLALPVRRSCPHRPSPLLRLAGVVALLQKMPGCPNQVRDLSSALRGPSGGKGKTTTSWSSPQNSALAETSGAGWTRTTGRRIMSPPHSVFARIPKGTEDSRSPWLDRRFGPRPFAWVMRRKPLFAGVGVGKVWAGVCQGQGPGPAPGMRDPI